MNISLNLTKIMYKKKIVDSISAQLSKLNITAQTGDDTDISLSCIFYDTKWRTGNKKIDFEAAAYADEALEVLFYWESTGGTDLYRRVRGTGYDIEGKSFEYLVELESITNIFKETAERFGWKYRYVMNKEKAMHPSMQEFIPIIKQEMKQELQQEIKQESQQQQEFKHPIKEEIEREFNLQTKEEIEQEIKQRIEKQIEQEIKQQTKKEIEKEDDQGCHPAQPLHKLKQKPLYQPSRERVKKFCKYCGNKIEPDFIFCSRCGAQLKKENTLL